MSPGAPTDLWAEAATLIGEVARRAENARRYRGLAATVAEPSFERAIAIGSDVRHAARRGATAFLIPMLAELRVLGDRCEAAVHGVRASPPYRELVQAFEGGDTTRATELASLVFDRVHVGAHESRAYWAVPLAAGKSLDHFLPADACAERIANIAEQGLTAPSDAPALGGDEVVRPLHLSSTHDESESPIALAFDPGTIQSPVGRLEGGEVVLVYTPRLRTTFTVSYTAEVTDEWWRIRPDAYVRYLEALRAALTARSITLVRA